MPLPKIQHPTFPVTVPSTKKKIRLRPYTVKEEKILLAAQSSDDNDETIYAVKQVVSNCTMGDFDVETAPMFDVEYLFIKLRAISVSSVVELTYTNPDELDAKGNPHQYEFEVDLENVEVRFLEEHKNKIDLGGDVGCVMRYPSFDTMKKVKAQLEASLLEPSKDVSVEALFMIYAESIDTVYDEDKVYKAGVDFDMTEMKDFIDGLSSKALEDIQGFFETIPTIYYEIKYTNKNGELKTIPLTGLSDFFTL